MYDLGGKLDKLVLKYKIQYYIFLGYQNALERIDQGILKSSSPASLRANMRLACQLLHVDYSHVKHRLSSFHYNVL